MSRIIVLAVALAALALGAVDAFAADVRSFEVFKGETAVLSFRDEPGPLVSTAMLPPGARPTMHPFLSATALRAEEEDALGTILGQSRDAADFADRLRAAGYEVRESAKR